MKLAPVVSVALVIGLIGYILGMSAPSTPAQSGWSGVPTADQLMGRSPGPIGVVHPRDWIVLYGSDGPYHVPSGKIAVWTGLGTADNSTTDVKLQLSADGVSYRNAAAASADCNDGNGASMKLLPTGLTSRPLEWAQLWTNGSEAIAWGYLVDA